MLKNKLVIVLPLLLAGCTMSDSQLKRAYANHYYQDPAYVAAYKQKTETMSVNQLADYGAEFDKQKMRGQKRMQLDKFIYIENIHSEDNKVIYNYSLTDAWNALSASDRLEKQTNMQKDLTYRTCSLKTVQLAQKKGLEEVHNYYTAYPDKIAFTLRSNLQMCRQAGFTD